MGNLKHRRIDFKFSLGASRGYFEGVSDTLELKGLRAQVDITQAGGLAMAEANVRIYGMELSAMNKLTQLFTVYPQGVDTNTIDIFAGDDDGTSLCFSGTLYQAWVDSRSMPDVFFWAKAQSGLFDATKAVSPSSYKGSVSVAFLMEQIARAMTPPRAFKNNGVDITLQNPYLPGTLREQILAIVQAAKINVLDDGATLWIWPEGAAREDATIRVAPETGMAGYPAYADNAIQVTALYNPSLLVGTKITVASDLEPASGDWNIFAMNHNLDTLVPNGEWFTRVDCAKELGRVG